MVLVFLATGKPLLSSSTGLVCEMELTLQDNTLLLLQFISNIKVVFMQLINFAFSGLDESIRCSFVLLLKIFNFLSTVCQICGLVRKRNTLSLLCNAN